MKKTETLKKNYEFRRILNKGKYISAEYLECFYLKNNKHINFIGIAISAKLAKAHKRNEIKRYIRENYTELEEKLDTGMSMVFLVKKHKNIEEISFYTVKNDMEKILKEMEIYHVG